MGIVLGGCYVFVVGDERMKTGAGSSMSGGGKRVGGRRGGEGLRGGGGEGREGKQGLRGGGQGLRGGVGSSSRRETRGRITGGKRMDRIKSWGERLFGSGNNDYEYAEAESRLMVALPGLAIATAGLLVWGFCGEYGPALDAAAAASTAGNNNSTSGSGNGNVTVPGVGPGLGSGNGGGGYGVNRYSWLGLMFAFGMVGFGMAGVPGVWFNYVSLPFLSFPSLHHQLLPIIFFFILNAYTAH